MKKYTSVSYTHLDVYKRQAQQRVTGIGCGGGYSGSGNEEYIYINFLMLGRD